MKPENIELAKELFKKIEYFEEKAESVSRITGNIQILINSNELNTGHVLDLNHDYAQDLNEGVMLYLQESLESILESIDQQIKEL